MWPRTGTGRRSWSGSFCTGATPRPSRRRPPRTRRMRCRGNGRCGAGETRGRCGAGETGGRCGAGETAADAVPGKRAADAVPGTLAAAARARDAGSFRALSAAAASVGDPGAEAVLLTLATTIAPSGALAVGAARAAFQAAEKLPAATAWPLRRRVVEALLDRRPEIAAAAPQGLGLRVPAASRGIRRGRSRRRARGAGDPRSGGGARKARGGGSRDAVRAPGHEPRRLGLAGAARVADRGRVAAVARRGGFRGPRDVVGAGGRAGRAGCALRDDGRRRAALDAARAGGAELSDRCACRRDARRCADSRGDVAGLRARCAADRRDAGACSRGDRGGVGGGAGRGRARVDARRGSAAGPRARASRGAGAVRRAAPDGSVVPGDGRCVCRRAAGGSGDSGARHRASRRKR